MSEGTTLPPETTGSINKSGFLGSRINRWWIVFGCALVNVFASGVFVLYSVNIFFVDASLKFGWTKSTISMLLSVFFFSAGLGFPMLGWAIPV